MMKPILFALLALNPLSHANAKQAEAPPVSTPMFMERVPRDLKFLANNLEIQNPSWFATLFPKASCNGALEAGGSKVKGWLQLAGNTASQVDLSFNGSNSALVSGALTYFVPVYIQNSNEVGGHYVIETKANGRNWVKFQLDLSADGSTLSLSLIQGRPGSERLVPVLTSHIEH